MVPVTEAFAGIKLGTKFRKKGDNQQAILHLRRISHPQTLEGTLFLYNKRDRSFIHSVSKGVYESTSSPTILVTISH